MIRVSSFSASKSYGHYNVIIANSLHWFDTDVNPPKDVVYSPGDIAWVLASTALVWIMVPGVGFFYSGLLRCVWIVSYSFIFVPYTPLKDVKMLFRWYTWAWWQLQWFPSKCVPYSSHTCHANIKIPNIVISGFSGVSLWLSVTVRALSLAILVCFIMKDFHIYTHPDHNSSRIFCPKRSRGIPIYCKRPNSIHCFLYLPTYVRRHNVCFFLPSSQIFVT